MRNMNEQDRRSALEQLSPPSWRERYGEEPFDDAYCEWVASLPTDPGPWTSSQSVAHSQR